MRYEKPQKGNPYNLVINQHIFPAQSIKRFCDASGKVDVFLKLKTKRIELNPNSQLFCARRTWDQRAEVGFMKTIEDSFQELATKIVNCKITNLDETDHCVLVAFFALWEHRYSHNSEPISDTELIGVQPGDGLTKDEEELLEKNEVTYARKQGSCAIIPSRFMNGSNIQISIDRRRNQMKNLKWGIIKSLEGEFLVPDNNFGSTTIIPVSPDIILLGNSENLTIPLSEITKVNQLAISTSKTYYFARDISRCPI